ncbi:MAG: aspartate--tRNA ligase [Corynebacteriales bacterium]|nr:aspartate--tRNA ligase [Mycobacteriales bacterium]
MSHPYRTIGAGTLRSDHVGETVTLSGWVARRRDHGGVIFIDLRDASGYVQVVLQDDENSHGLRSEYCVRIVGDVRARPAGNENPELPTGAIEIAAAELTVLSEAAPLPFPIDGQTAGEVGEESRLKYRYLDLRRGSAQKVLRMRSAANAIAREVMLRHEFVEIETPNLTRSTPEGARDFIVPVRLQPGHWYALPQSPQLFKQLLMVAGMERYFQIARCFRDEDFRADRQPEFTQLDLEMSFVSRDEVLDLAEEIIVALWRELAGVEIPRPFPRLSFADALSRYGSDKPDVRFGNELVDCTEYFAQTPFRVFQAAHVGAVVMPGGANQTRKELDGWQEWARARGAKGLAYVLVQPDGELGGPVAKNLSDAEKAGLAAHVGAQPGDAVFFAAGPIRREALELLGAARLEIGKRCGLIDESQWAFLHVVDFPMFQPTDTGWTAEHHPFTAPTAEWLDTFDKDPENALADAYDLVCNGWEIMSGSVRIHQSDVQRRVFETIGLTADQTESKFGFLLEAFQYGPPPHAGAALGWDRITALLAGVDSIREVIAFPKVASGGDPLTGAPTPITPAQRKEAGIDAVIESAN